MKRYALLTAIAVMASLASIPGRSADLSLKAPPQAIPAYGQWAGFYGGVFGGYGLDWSGTDINGGTLATLGNAPHGWSGGVRLGYDFQSGPLVFGIEADGSLASFDASGNMSGLSVSNATNWWGSVNGRLGFTGIGSNVLPYAIGGVAFGGDKTTFDAPNLAAGVSKTSTGWDAGGGIEARLPNSPFSIFGEYRYVDLGGSGNVPLAPGVFGSERYTFSIVQAGINLRF